MPDKDHKRVWWMNLEKKWLLFYSKKICASVSFFPYFLSKFSDFIHHRSFIFAKLFNEWNREIVNLIKSKNYCSLFHQFKEYSWVYSWIGDTLSCVPPQDFRYPSVFVCVCVLLQLQVIFLFAPKKKKRKKHNETYTECLEPAHKCVSKLIWKCVNE